MITRFGRFFQQQKDWNDATESNDLFLKNNRNLFKNLRIGCSFAPEQVEFLLKKDTIKHPSVTALTCLKKIVEDFHISDIRLGIRWNSVDTNGTIDISYYKPYLEYCFKKNIAITLNVGPIKTFRWPEQFVPEYILKKTQLPPIGAEIACDSQLAKHARTYLEKLYTVLTKEYTPEQRANITIIQIENEPFHPFGTYRWRMSEEYMESLYSLTYKYFPDVSLVINSSETRNLKKTARFYNHLIQKNPELKNKLIVGYNYFYNVPNARTFPMVGTLDSITLSNVTFQRLCQKNITWSENIGYTIEVTEAQTEPWLPIKSPGNSAQEFRFLLLRTSQFLLNCRKKSLMRIWGIEHLALSTIHGTDTLEHQQIVDLIQRINQK
jgi:hypothetical protein